METIKDLKHLVEKELKMIVNDDSLDDKTLDISMRAVCLLNAIEDLEMKEMGNYNSYSVDYSGMDDYRDSYSGARMRSPMTGRFVRSHDESNSYRDNYRDNYSDHDKEDLIKDLEMKMQYANSDRERQSIRETIDIIRRQN